MGRDRTHWTALRGPVCLATLTALVCDLQSMFHKTLPHLTVITNKHHAQSLRLLSCLLAQVASSSLCGPSLKEAKKYPGLLSLTEDPSGKGKRRAGEETLFPGTTTATPLMPRCVEGNIQQHRKDLFWEVGKRLNHSHTLSLPQT